jgi:hypothetical protein
MGSGIAVPQDSVYVPTSAYDRVRGQLFRLAAQLGVAADFDRIGQAFAAVCRRSLAFPLAGPVPRFSRINADGTPFQFAAAAGVAAPTLEFLGDPGWDGASGAPRLRAGRTCIATVARIVGADAELREIEPVLDDLAPENARDLLADRGGVFWIGAGFAPRRAAALRIYVNGAWGGEAHRCARLRRLAAHFGLLEAWLEAESALPRGMKPLGAALTVARGAATTGRIYVSGYGRCLQEYVDLARAVCSEPFADVLRRYGECLLGDAAAHPTPTAVCSFGLAAGCALDFKLELCCHCLFKNDVEASTRLRECFATVEAADGQYLQLLDILSDGRLRAADVERPVLDGKRLRLHSYAGVGVKRGAEYFPVYLQPALGGYR